MNKIVGSLLVVALFGLACQSSNKEEDSKWDKEFQNLDEYFIALTDLEKFNGAVLVHKDDEVILHKAYNMNADPNHSLHVETNSQFDIHSISKLMAQYCITRLESEKLITSKDKISDHIQGFPNGEQISIKNLLENQSGLPREFSEEPDNLVDLAPADLIELIKKEDLLFAPGTEALYSNLGYQIVYFIISKLTKKPFVQYLNDEIFEPQEMHDSGAHFHFKKDNLTRPVKNHTKEGGEIKVLPNYDESSKNQSIVYSSTKDLLKFIKLAKVEPYRSALMNRAGTIGWSGGGEGILSHAEANTNADYELIFFSNFDEIPFGNIIKDVELIMTGQDYEVPKEINRIPIAISTKTMEKYVGKYDMAEFDHHEFEIRLEKDSIAFYQNGDFGGMLQAENDTTLFGDPKDEDYFVMRPNLDTGFNLVYKYKGVDIVGKKK